MARPFNILLGLSHEVTFDRRAFEGIATLANERGDVRLTNKFSGAPWPDVVRASRIDGIIVARRFVHAYDDLDALGIPFVTLADSPTLAARQHIVAMNDQAIGVMAARHFLDAGYQSFAVCVQPCTPNSLAVRTHACIEEIRAAGWPCELGPNVTRPPPYPDSYEDSSTWAADAGAWLCGLPKPLAVFAPYDFHARVMVNVAHSVNLRVPDDVAVLGVDDDDLYTMTTSPQLSSVITPGKLVGQQALSRLIAVLSGRADVPRRTLIDPPGIMVRGSSSGFAVQDEDVITAVRYIRDHAARGVTVDQVAHHVALSRRTLERRFLAALSHTVRDEIRRAKVSGAKRLLMDTDLPYPEVARRSGLVLQQQLNRLIKLDTGQTPVQFRQAARQYRNV